MMDGRSGRVRFALIGCGEIGLHTAESARRAADTCELTVVQDIVPELARDCAEHYGVPWCADYGAVLARKDVDAVVISTPHYLHAPLTVQAARAGKHVLCEKPIACTLAQADEMIAACRESGVRLSVLHTTRFGPGLAEIREQLHQGIIGRIVALHISRFIGKPESYWNGGYSGRAKSDWRKSKEKAGGGVAIMNLIHDTDRLHWLAGLTPERVYAEMDTHCTATEVEDDIAIVVRYTNGAIGSIVGCSCAHGKGLNASRLVGTCGQMSLEGSGGVFTTRQTTPGLAPEVWHEFPKRQKRSDQRAVQMRMFAEAVLSRVENAPLPVSGEEARASLAFILAAYESAGRKAPVLLGGAEAAPTREAR